MKYKSIWYCSSCGHRQARWSGQCPTCSEWNTFTEEIETPSRSPVQQAIKKAPSPLSKINLQPVSRYQSCFSELDRALGGGFVPGALVLIGGDPGIGKSTLCLQLAESLGQQKQTVLYISGEESLEQLAMRANRLHATSESILFSNETEVGAICQHLEKERPTLAIIDSIQIMYKHEIPSSPGSVTQVRECTSTLMQVAKSLHITLFIIGHVTKTGEIAGPRVLEHLVDTVLYFEGEKQQNVRIIRSIKNRFGPTDEIAVFHMEQMGLKEIKNPSQLFIEDRTKECAGTVIMTTIEGTRPLLLEAQALVTKTFYATPSRKCTGVDPNRLALLLAVCEKKASLRLYQSDVFVSITGGMKVTEPGADLGLLLAIVSSYTDKIFDPGTAVAGEVGLSGEIRAIPRIEARVKEAIQMGFSRCLIPAKNLENVKAFQDAIEIHPIKWVDEAITRFV